MNLHNVRLGFATNSSSSHSIVLLGDKRPADALVDGQDFGWHNFTLASKATKRGYLAQTLSRTFYREFPKDVAALCVESWLDTKLDPEGYVDHESALDLPCRFNHPSVDPNFVADFAAFLDREDVAILGGNDNNEIHPLLGKTQEVQLGLPQDYHVKSGSLTCRSEGEGLWTLFNRDTGARFVVDFQAPLKSQTKRLATKIPLLVDLKITDYCTAGCDFCYQGSSPEGKHAEDYYSAIKAMADLKIFEVAIGGGEPTLHPGFIAMLELCRWEGIVPNFSTRSLAWLRDPEQWTRIIPLVGGFAFSCQDTAEIIQVASLVRANGIPGSKLSIQYVMGLDPQRDFERVLKTCWKFGVRLTLLGFKHVGRGQDYSYNYKDYNYRLYNYSDWLDVAGKQREEGCLPRLGIDTTLAAESRAGLEEADISKLLYQTSEDTSAYIDLVTKEMGPSSYSPREQRISFPGYVRAETLREKFQELRCWNSGL